MPLFIQPAYERLREYNQCHNPKGADGGQFCSDPDQTTPVTHQTTAGITSYRSKDQPGAGDRTNASTFARMHELTSALRSAGLEVDARPAQGAWEGAWEPSWAVGINPGENWDADATARTLAEYGKKFNQDAVLLMHQCVDDCNSASAELAFQGAIPRQHREAISNVLVAAGMEGWTWFKGANGQTTLRMVHVPPWAKRTLADHLEAVKLVSAQLASAGYTTATTRSRVRVEVMERDKRETPTPGVRSYDEVLSGGGPKKPLPRPKFGPVMGYGADRRWDRSGGP